MGDCMHAAFSQGSTMHGTMRVGQGIEWTACSQTCMARLSPKKRGSIVAENEQQNRHPVGRSILCKISPPPLGT